MGASALLKYRVSSCHLIYSFGVRLELQRVLVPNAASLIVVDQKA